MLHQSHIFILFPELLLLTTNKNLLIETRIWALLGDCVVVVFFVSEKRVITGE
jgi:hypothetical protein